jgi:hypothetical protein
MKYIYLFLLLIISNFLQAQISAGWKIGYLNGRVSNDIGSGSFEGGEGEFLLYLANGRVCAGFKGLVGKASAGDSIKGLGSFLGLDFDYYLLKKRIQPYVGMSTGLIDGFYSYSQNGKTNIGTYFSPKIGLDVYIFNNICAYISLNYMIISERDILSEKHKTQIPMIGVGLKWITTKISDSSTKL